VAGWLAARGFPYRFADRTDPAPPEPTPPSGYANFARVTATAEEVIIDFCLNAQPFATGRQEVKVSQRIILSFPTAKQVFLAVGEVLQEYEKAHGSIELDVRKRARTPS
jgi:hypothetical protein